MAKRVQDLTGAELDYWVARALGLEQPEICKCGSRSVCQYIHHHVAGDDGWWTDFKPSMDWEQGGPIIERERIQIVPWAVPGEDWEAKFYIGPANEGITAWGKSALEASMRCYVASRFGEKVPKQNINWPKSAEINYRQFKKMINIKKSGD